MNLLEWNARGAFNNSIFAPNLPCPIGSGGVPVGLYLVSKNEKKKEKKEKEKKEKNKKKGGKKGIESKIR